MSKELYEKVKEIINKYPDYGNKKIVKLVEDAGFKGSRGDIKKIIREINEKKATAAIPIPDATTPPPTIVDDGRPPSPHPSPPPTDGGANDALFMALSDAAGGIPAPLPHTSYETSKDHVSSVASFFSGNGTPGEIRGVSALAEPETEGEYDLMMGSIFARYLVEKWWGTAHSRLILCDSIYFKNFTSIYNEFSHMSIKNLQKELIKRGITEYDVVDKKGKLYKKRIQHSDVAKNKVIFVNLILEEELGGEDKFFNIAFGSPRRAIETHAGDDEIVIRQPAKTLPGTNYDYKWLHSTLLSHVKLILYGEDSDADVQRSMVVDIGSQDRFLTLRAKGWVFGRNYSDYFNVIKEDIIKDSNGNRICSVLSFVFDIIYNMTKPPELKINKEHLTKPHNQNDGSPCEYLPPHPECSIIINYLSTMAIELVKCDSNKPNITKGEYEKVLRSYKTAAGEGNTTFLDFLNILVETINENIEEDDTAEYVEMVTIHGEMEESRDFSDLEEYISAILNYLFKHEDVQVPSAAAPFVGQRKKEKELKKSGAAMFRGPEPALETEGGTVRVELTGQIPAAESEPELDTKTLDELDRLYEEISNTAMYGEKTFSSMVPDNMLSMEDAIKYSTKIYHFLKNKRVAEILGEEQLRYFSGETGGAAQEFIPTNKVFWIALIMFILIIFANDPTYDDQFMVKGGVSLILNTQGEVSVSRTDTPDIDTSDIDISLKPDEEGGELPVISFNLAVTVLLTGHLLLISENSFNAGLSPEELKEYMKLNYSSWGTAGEEIKLVQIGKEYAVNGVANDYICDLVIENKPFREAEQNPSLLSIENQLSSELSRGIMSHFELTSVNYFKYRSLDGNIQEYDNMIKTMFSLAEGLLRESDKFKFRSNLSSFSNINVKLPKLKKRLMGFGETLSGENITERLAGIESNNNFERLSDIEKAIREKNGSFRMRASLKVKTLKSKKSKRKDKRKKSKKSNRRGKRNKSKKSKRKGKRKTKRKSKR